MSNPRNPRQPRNPRNSRQPRKPTVQATAIPDRLYENVHQLGGIITGTLDTPAYGPGMGSSAMPTRVAMFNTGSGLRFTVALDRGGDIVDAFYNQHSLMYLSPVGLRQPTPAAHVEPTAWLNNFAVGLLTTCGPRYIGGPRVEDGVQTTQHGHYSNSPASVQMLFNPDPRQGNNEMFLTLVSQDVRTLGCNVETRRTIHCTLGQPEIRISDRVTNLGNQRVAHNWLYHVNLGYPLLDVDARFILAGSAAYWQCPVGENGSLLRKISGKQLQSLKRVTGPNPEHVNGGERGLLIDPPADKQGNAHVGLVNRKLNLALELIYPVAQLPRLANWQLYGPGGTYVAGVEPYAGSLLGKNRDNHPLAANFLEPGEHRDYSLTLRIHADKTTIASFTRHDGPLTAR